MTAPSNLLSTWGTSGGGVAGRLAVESRRRRVRASRNMAANPPDRAREEAQELRGKNVRWRLDRVMYPTLEAVEVPLGPRHPIWFLPRKKHSASALHPEALKTCCKKAQAAAIT
eukprot:1160339-Pelagomonas_calceolata.AAC.9